MELETLLIEIDNREKLAQFVKALKRDFEVNRDDWENDSLSTFLEAMAAWIEDMNGYYKNMGHPFQERPSWKTIGEILMAARQYE